MIGLTPDITEARAVCHGVLAVTFADGLQGEVEVLKRMRGPVFDTARTSEGFARVEVDTETGTVTWPGGADLAPDTLYERVRTGTWPDQNLAA
ncbi:MAG: DUF2442 domain-containing protein [Thermoleophilaceae bacterium]